MIGLGYTNPFPLRLGGGSSDVEDERNAILDGVKDAIGLDPSDGTKNYAETAGEATALAMIWAVNKRLRNQAIAEKMLENLAVWEEATDLRPADDDLDTERRLRLAAKLRGQINNALPDIEEAARKFFGIAFVKMVLVDPADETTYWPGVNPGPPGYEWSSNRAIVAIRVDKSLLTGAQFFDKRDRLLAYFDSYLPTWMGFKIGVGDSFIVNKGIIGQTLI